MRNCLFIIFFLIPYYLLSQTEGNFKFSISETEAMAHMRIFSHEKQTSASNNFDVHYYRCEWEVDPTIRYINGKVTVYFTMLSESNAVSLDLMSPLVVDSVLNNNIPFSYEQSNNTLTVYFLAPKMSRIRKEYLGRLKFYFLF